jgi:hypothetical protein
MPNPFPTYEVLLNKRGRTWKWRVCTTNGDVIMLGSEGSRPAARYKASSALFLLLGAARYQEQPLGAEYGSATKDGA